MLLKLSYLQYEVIFLGASSPHMCKSPLSTICTALDKKKKHKIEKERKFSSLFYY